MSVTITQALFSLAPTAKWYMTNENNYATLVWLSTDIPKPTENQVNDEITMLTLQQPFDACSAEAKKRIAASDWSVLPDVNISNKAEFEAYRAELRAFIITPVANPVFPTEPQPVWI